MQRCQQCKSLMPDDENRCIRCGFEAVASSAMRLEDKPADKPADNMPPQKICPKCGHIHQPSKIAANDQCPSCGIFYQKYQDLEKKRELSNQTDSEQINETSGFGATPCYLGVIASLSFYTGFTLLVCGIIWLACKDTDEVATGYAKEALNHQITMILGLIVPILLSFSSSVLAGIVAIAWLILFLITPIIAAVKAGKGLTYRYPLVIHFFGDVQSD